MSVLTKVSTAKRTIAGKLVFWLLFAAAFGMVEAVCVTYLRQLLGITGDYRTYAHTKEIAFTTHAISDVLAEHGLLNIEWTREIATILLLAGGSWAVGKNLRERFGYFAISFATWDLSYYLFLKTLTGFPSRLTDTDIYFLIPIDWYGPVWFPVLVAMPLFLTAGLILIRKQDTDEGFIE